MAICFDYDWVADLEAMLLKKSKIGEHEMAAFARSAPVRCAKIGRRHIQALVDDQLHKDVQPAMAIRHRCPIPNCTLIFNDQKIRLWHQLMHFKHLRGLDNKWIFGASVEFEHTNPFTFAFECIDPMCTEKFEDQMDCKWHYMMAHVNLRISCCETVFDNYPEYWNHRILAPLNNSHYEWMSFYCSLCDNLWRNRKDYSDHLDTHTTKCFDPLCKHLSNNTLTGAAHFYLDHDDGWLVYDTSVLINFAAFAKFYKQLSRQFLPRNIRCSYYCRECRVGFDSDIYYIRHNQIHLQLPLHTKAITKCCCGFTELLCFDQKYSIYKIIKAALFAHASGEMDKNYGFNTIKKYYKIYPLMILLYAQLINDIQQKPKKLDTHSKMAEKGHVKLLMNALKLHIKPKDFETNTMKLMDMVKEFRATRMDKK